MLRSSERIEVEQPLVLGVPARRLALAPPAWLTALVRSPALVVATPAILAGLLCAYKLGVRSLWLDESATVSIASQYGHTLWAGIAHDGGNMAAYYVLMHAVIVLFGDGTTAIRMPSLVANAVTAGLVAVLALRLFGRREVALLAGVLVGLSLPLVYWGQDARGYALMVTFCTGSFLALVELLRAPASGPVPRWAVVAYVLCTVAALYVGYDTAILIPAQLALLWAFPGRARTVLGCLAAVALCCLPLLALAILRGSGQLFWVPPLSLHVLRQTTVTLLSAGLPPNFHVTEVANVGALLSLLLTIAAVVACVRGWRRDHRDIAGWGPAVCAAWVVIPAALVLIVAAAGQPVELARCTVLLMPGLSLLLAWALTHPGVPRYASIAGVAALLALRLLAVGPTYGHSPENWKGATTYVVSVSARQGACVMFYPQDARMAFDYYVRQDGVAAAARLTPVLPTAPWTAVKAYVQEYRIPSRAELRQIVARCPRLWLVSSHEGNDNGPRLSGYDYVKYQRLVSELGWVYPHQNLVQFGYSATVYGWQLSR